MLAAATLAPGYAVLELDAAPAGKLRVGAAADGAAAISVLAAGDCAWREGFAASGLDGLPRTGAGYDDGGVEVNVDIPKEAWTHAFPDGARIERVFCD